MSTLLTSRDQKMATFFSAGFFSFLPGDSTQIVSKYIWIYFLLTGVTTLLVFLGWYLFSERESKKIMTAMNPEINGSRVRNEQPDDHEKDIAMTPPPPALSSLWTTRSRSNADTDPFTSFGGSPDALGGVFK